MKPSLTFKWLIPMLLLVASGLATAQDQYADPPTRVARLQFLDGEVSLQPGGVEEWAFAALNRPLTTADRLWVDRDSRAELSIGSAAMRLGSETSIALTNLDDNVAQIELDQGTLSISVRSLDRGELVEIDTPNIAFTPNEPGEYRIDVNPDEGRTWVTVRRGSGTASGQTASAQLERGDLYEFFNGDSGEYTLANAMPRDDFEGWCRERERRELASVSLQYVAPGTIGYEALDEYGDWRPMPTYGSVWFPRVSAGWAPYHTGHWIWVEPWGWTWVDDAPWGFAPFHYGRWSYISGRWGWIPGPREVRPVYAPALVAWIGGPNFGVSIGIGGGVGWVPLGWRDPYIPYYHVSPRYAERVNITNSRVVNTTIINNYYSTTNVNVRNTTINNIRYENVRIQNAVTVVPGNALASGRPVQQVAVRVQPQAIGRATFARAPEVAPTRQAVLGPRPMSTAPSRLVSPKQVVVKTPPPPPPVSFERQRPLLEKSKGMPLPPAERANLRTSMPAAPVHARPPIVTVKPTTRQAPPAANKGPALPPSPMRRGGPAPNARTSGEATPTTPAPGARPNAPGRLTSPAEGREAVTPGGRPVTPARPATPATGRELPGARPATPATPATPASPAVGRENPSAGRPAPSERLTPPGEGREMNRPEPPARSVTPPERPTARPSSPTPPSERRETNPSAGRPEPPSERPAPQERTMERPISPPRPAPQERTMERPAPPSRPAPQERTMERPAPPSRPAPQERSTERNAPRPPANRGEAQKEKGQGQDNSNDNRDRNKPER